MADFFASAAAMRARLETYTALPLYWPNDARDATFAAAPNGFVYSEIRVLHGSPIGFQTGAGQPWRDKCELAVTVYVPSRTSIGAAEVHAQQITNLFTVDAVPDVKVTSKRIGDGQRMDLPHGSYYGLPVYIDFFSDRLE